MSKDLHTAEVDFAHDAGWISAEKIADDIVEFLNPAVGHSCLPGTGTVEGAKKYSHWAAVRVTITVEIMHRDNS